MEVLYAGVAAPVRVVACRLWLLGWQSHRLVGYVASGLVWVFQIMYRFSASFPYKLVNSLLLYEEAELLPVARKKKIEQVARQTHL